MENVSREEEMRRFAIAIAAAEESGAKHVSMIDGPVDENRRSYFYAVPTGEGKFQTEDLAKGLLDSDVPVLVNWDKKSENYGLRYTMKGLRVPERLQAFQSDDAKTEWADWKSKEKAMLKVVSTASRLAASGSELAFLDQEISANRGGRGSKQIEL